MSDPSPIRLALVDDDPMVRAALRMMLGGDSGIEVVGEATNGEEALTLVPTSGAEVVLMDIRMPVRDGLSATALLLQRCPRLKIIVLTTFATDDMVLAALRLGAAGFMLKDTPPARLVEAVRTVAGLDSLTDREREVAGAVGRGPSNAEISADAFMSVPTVKTHVGRLNTELEVDNRVQLAILVHDAAE